MITQRATFHTFILLYLNGLTGISHRSNYRARKASNLPPFGAKFYSLLTPLFDPRLNNATAVPRGARLVTTHSSPLPPTERPIAPPAHRAGPSPQILFFSIYSYDFAKLTEEHVFPSKLSGKTTSNSQTCHGRNTCRQGSGIICGAEVY